MKNPRIARSAVLPCLAALISPCRSSAPPSPSLRPAALRPAPPARSTPSRPSSAHCWPRPRRPSPPRRSELHLAATREMPSPPSRNLQGTLLKAGCRRPPARHRQLHHRGDRHPQRHGYPRDRGLRLLQRDFDHAGQHERRVFFHRPRRRLLHRHRQRDHQRHLLRRRGGEPSHSNCGGTVSGADIALSPAGNATVTGTVTDSFNQPVSNGTSRFKAVPAAPPHITRTRLPATATIRSAAH